MRLRQWSSFLSRYRGLNLLTIELVLRKWLSILLLFTFIFFLFSCLIALVVLVIVLAGIFSIYTKSNFAWTRSRDWKDFPHKEEEAKDWRTKTRGKKESNKHGGRRRWPKKDTSRFRYPWSPRDRLKHRSPYCWCQQFWAQTGTHFHGATILVWRNSFGRPESTPLGLFRGVWHVEA